MRHIRHSGYIIMQICTLKINDFCVFNNAQNIDIIGNGDDMKKIATINDLSGFGKCSLGVALPIISSMGIQCCPLTTGVFSNQTGYPSYKSVDFTDYMEEFIDEWKKLDAHFDGIITGFIPNSKQGRIISSFIDTFKRDNTIVLVDPVMGDNGELYPCYDNESINAIKSLSKKADIITPNLTELCCLCYEDYNNISSLSYNALIDKIASMSKSLNQIVITTGINISTDEIGTAVYQNGNIDVVKSKKIGGSFSGTGDILASIIGASAVKGIPLLDATKMASKFITKSIEQTIKDTNGDFNPADGVHFEGQLMSLGDYYEAK